MTAYQETSQHESTWQYTSLTPRPTENPGNKVDRKGLLNNCGKHVLENRKEIISADN